MSTRMYKDNKKTKITGFGRSGIKTTIIAHFIVKRSPQSRTTNVNTANDKLNFVCWLLILGYIERNEVKS